MATITTVLLATGAAAATGSLPGPAQDAVSGVADVVGVTLPDAASDTAEQHVADEAERAARKAAHEADLADQKAQKAAEKILHEGEVDATDEETVGAEHGIGKGTPASDAGKDAHVARDNHLQDVADRQAGHDSAPAGDGTQVDDEDGTPASEQGQAGHDRRDDQLGVIAEQKAERDALKAERPSDDADDSDDVADDDQGDDDQADDVADDDQGDDDQGDDVADDDADHGDDVAKDKSGHGDEHEDDEADDAPATLPAV